MSVRAILADLKKLRLKPDGDFYLPDLKPFIKEHKYDHDLALKLWASDLKPAMTLAYSILDPAKVDEALIDEWVERLDDWDICDGFTGVLVRYTPYAETKPFEWAQRGETYVRRAAFALIAQMAWQKNNAFKNSFFRKSLTLVEDYAHDDRLHVKKAVNWALRDIGKRNDALLPHALKTACSLQKSSHKIERWVGMHRMKELDA